MLNRIKKKQDAVEAKAIAPNNKLYLWLLLGAIELLVVLFAFAWHNEILLCLMLLYMFFGEILF